jgi:hypothetical protein
MYKIIDKKYAGIGSRKTLLKEQMLETKIATILEKKGYCLYSGHADGSDKAFENGVKDPINKRIIIPNKGYNGSESIYFDVPEEAYEIASQFHPVWLKLKPYVKKLIARTSVVILDYDLKTPVKFIVCWTPNGKVVGGTGQALRIAKHYNIRVFNLYFRDHIKELSKFIYVST